MNIPPPPHLRDPLELPPELRHPEFTIRRRLAAIAQGALDILDPAGTRVLRYDYKLIGGYFVRRIDDPDMTLLTLDETQGLNKYTYRVLDHRAVRLGTIRSRKWRWSERVVWEITDGADGLIATCVETELGPAVMRRVVGVCGRWKLHFPATYGETLATADMAWNRSSIHLAMPQGGNTHLLDPRLVLATGILLVNNP